ncbi:MAG: iron-sulfur cluster assembly scaffold protein [Patescibacteria group bacterium]
MADVDKWVYSSVVKDHFMHPRNFLDRDPQGGEFDAEGEVGSFACGDIIKIWIKIDKETDKIKDIKWRTWGCATAIASASIFTEMVKENGGMSLEDALKIKPQDIAEKLGGLPARKFHCSILADKAFKKAVEAFRNIK